MTISRQFYEVANKYPNKEAVILGAIGITYSELLLRVQQQANTLRMNGFGRRDHLAIQLTGGIDFVVMMLAAADVGVALLPLSPDLPHHALNKIAALTDTKVIISEGLQPDNSMSHKLKFHGTDEDLYLLISTSGSTGDPKPIMLKQGTKLKRVNALIDLYSITENDTTLISTPLYHSMGQRLILASVLTGGTLVIMQKWSVT